MSISGTLACHSLEFNMGPQLLEDLRQARREIELLKTMVGSVRDPVYATPLSLAF